METLLERFCGLRKSGWANGCFVKASWCSWSVVVGESCCMGECGLDVACWRCMGGDDEGSRLEREAGCCAKGGFKGVCCSCLGCRVGQGWVASAML